MNRDLQILITNHPGATIVKLVGEARMDTDADELLSLPANHPQKVIIDATDLTFIASVGMRLLINLQRALAAQGGKLRIAGLRPALCRAFQEAKLMPLFELHPDVPSAMA
ncbi:MAG: STAS domain-containing protein [Phycisphaerae bacterium]